MPQPASAGSSINRDLGATIDAGTTGINFAIAKLTANGTPLGGADLRGYEGAVVFMYVGVTGDTLSGSIYVTPTVQDSDDGSTGWADLAAGKFKVDTFTNYSSTTPTVVRGAAGAAWTVAPGNIDATTKDDVLIKVSVYPGAGVKRYIRPIFSFTGTHTNGINVTAFVVRGFPRVAPAV